MSVVFAAKPERDPDGPMVRCRVCGAEYPANHEHPAELCARQQFEVHVADKHERLERRQRLLAQTLWMTLHALAREFGSSSASGMARDLKAEWGSDIT